MNLTDLSDRAKCTAVQTAFRKHVEAFVAEHGLALGDGPIRAKYTSDRVTLTVEVVYPGGKSRAVSEYEQFQALYPRLPAVGFKFSAGREQFVVTGARGGRTNKPIIAQRADGKSFVFPISAIEAYAVTAAADAVSNAMQTAKAKTKKAA